MTISLNNLQPRRTFCGQMAGGIGAIAMASLLDQDGCLGDEPAGSGILHAPHVPARAKRCIHVFSPGGVSQVDTFDHKPALETLDGKRLMGKGEIDTFFGKIGVLRKSFYRFKQHGQSGSWVSSLMPHLATCADDLTYFHTLVSRSSSHTPACFQMNTGFTQVGFPSVGSWLSYGLGTLNNELPTFVVLPDPRGLPNGGTSNWSQGFLPAQHQGIVFRGGTQPVRDLFPPTKQPRGADAAVQKFLSTLNRQRTTSPADGLVDARIRSYELAARMQASVPEVSDLTGEPRHIQDMYGLNNKMTADCGRRCLLGRRLLEQGVRFVQIYSGGPIAGSPRASWDAHESVRQNHGFEASRIDRPVAALLRDLRQRGMLDDTLVLFTTEFGRTPFAQSAANAVGPGRDHNRYGFSGWLAGGGVRRGASYGSTDDVGWKAAENPMPWHDFHATLLHLLGVNHTDLTYYHNGIQRRLTNVHGEVHTGVFA